MSAALSLMEGTTSTTQLKGWCVNAHKLLASCKQIAPQKSKSIKRLVKFYWRNSVSVPVPVQLPKMGKTKCSHSKDGTFLYCNALYSYRSTSDNCMCLRRYTRHSSWRCCRYRMSPQADRARSLLRGYRYAPAVGLPKQDLLYPFLLYGAAIELS